ncbi:MAG: hypothetical protein GKR89_16645 [Candidatus Latescibacteria bacterium]|nr:hypothetical protein [Candidatus Latescibacterota bacterium]
MSEKSIRARTWAAKSFSRQTLMHCWPVILGLVLGLAQSGAAQSRFVVGAEGVTWASGGGHRDPTVLFKRRGFSTQEDTTNAPGGSIDFVHRSGWISPLFFPPDQNIAARVLDGDGSVFIEGGGYGVETAKQLLGTVNGDHEVAFERRPDAFNVTPRIRDVWVLLDFAVPVGVHRVRFYPRNTVVATPLLPFQGDYLRAFELWINPTATDIDAPDRLVARDTANEQPVVDIDLAPQYVRQVKLRSLAAIPFEIDELEVYGTGYMEEGTYLSDIIDLEQRATVGPLRWVEEVEGDSLFSKLSVRLRTGLDDTPFHYRKWVRDSEGAVTGFDEVYPTAYYSLDRRDRVPLGEEDDDNWSPWVNVENGGRIVAPMPRRYLQVQLDFNGGLFTTRAVDRLDFDYLVPPIADQLRAEVYPRLAAAEEPASFRYAVRLGADDSVRGFDRLEVDTNVAATAVRQVKLDGRAYDFELDYIREDGFALRFPLIERDGAVLEFTFDLPIFRFGTTFSGRVFNSDAPGVPQPLEPGQAADFGPDDNPDLSGLFVAIPKKQLGRLVGQIESPVRVVTPNGDGVNERFHLSFNLLQLVQPAPVAVDIFALDGRRLHRGQLQERGVGPVQCQWDGRDGQGRLVPPGLYIWVLAVEADAFVERHTGTVAVVY